MKNIFKISAIGLTLVLLSDVANAATATGDARARVAANISITKGNDIQFGLFTAPTTGTGTIDQSGTATGATAIAGGATRGPGTFSVAGEVSVPYTFTLPATVTLTRSGGAETMTAALSLASGTASRTLSAGGTDTVTVNGVLTVAANQVPGDYLGSYSVDVNYQ